ncbi:MAG: acyl-CoA thioesterase [Acidimicrobiales bacterium]
MSTDSGEAGTEGGADDSSSGVQRNDLLSALELVPTGDRSFRAGNVATAAGGVVFGGQLLAQTIVAASSVDPSKVVQSVHTVFARGASPDAPLDISVEPMHVGRALASATVTVSQGDRLCTRSLALLSASEPDLFRHAAGAPRTGAPEHAPESAHGGGTWEIRVVDGVDVGDPDAIGPPELLVWTRFRDVVARGAKGQALLAYATDGFLIGTAMRPHPGVGQSMAHVSISTSVLTHTLTFHEPVDASRWHLLAHESPFAGNGRTYGRAQVFDEDGRLVASFVQDNMVRSFPEGRHPGPGARAKA